MGYRLCQKKIPQHLSKLGESTLGKIACMHLSNVELLQENGSRLSLLESQPLMRGGGGGEEGGSGGGGGGGGAEGNTFTLGCRSCTEIMPSSKVHRQAHSITQFAAA